MSVAGALLAAGGSSRFGRPKALAELRGVSFVRRLAGELAAVAAPVLVVAPPNAGAIALELSGLGVRVIVNRQPARGMGSSLATAARALAAVEPDASALLVALVDQPLVDRELLARLVAAAATSGWGACEYADGTIGPPALFPSEAFGALAALSGERGARELLRVAGDRLALVPFPGGLVDIDTPADYERLSTLDAPAAGAGAGEREGEEITAGDEPRT